MLPKLQSVVQHVSSGKQVHKIVMPDMSQSPGSRLDVDLLRCESEEHLEDQYFLSAINGEKTIFLISAV